MTNLDSILKSRDITLPTKVCLVKAMVFPIVMYGCESWTIKKAEQRRINAFELWCWRRLLRVPWTARRSKQSILKEISPESSLEGLMLKLKLQPFDSLMKLLDVITDSIDMNLSELWELVMGREAWRAADHGVTKSQTRLSNWTELNWDVLDVGSNFVIQWESHFFSGPIFVCVTWRENKDICWKQIPVVVCLYSMVVLCTEKAMAPHTSILAWRIPWIEEPGRLQSMGSLRVGYDWATSLSLFTFMHWRRKWQPTPVFLPGESQGWGGLVRCCLWGHTESDTTEAT